MLRMQGELNSRNATLTLLRMVGPGSPPDVGGLATFARTT